MRKLMIILFLMVMVLAASDTFSLDLSLGPGLSVKNALLNVIALVLILQVTLGTRFKLELPALHAWFGILIGYALLSWMVVVVLVHYPQYSWTDGAIRLKGDLIDHALFFGVVFYGCRTSEDARAFKSLLLIVIAAMNLVTIANLAGIIDLGISEMGREGGEEAGRVFGPFGHPNAAAAVIVTVMPGYIAAMMGSSGMRRAFWLAAFLVSFVMLMLTGSRGGMVGVVVGGLAGAFLCRRYISGRAFSVTLASILAAVVIVTPVVALLSAGHGNIMIDRILSFDPATGGSGRNAIWKAAIDKMMGTPATLITGFGWNAYSVMNFYYAPHNQYLSLWFELGIVGVGSYIMLLREAIWSGLMAVPVSEPHDRSQLIAFVIGMSMLAVALFFTQLYKATPYVWMYVGAIMRLACSAISARRTATAVRAPSRLKRAATAAFR